MQNNENFRNDLIIKYLKHLAEIDSKDIFNNYFVKVKDYLFLLSNNSNDLSVLEDIKTIVAYNNEKIEKGVIL